MIKIEPEICSPIVKKTHKRYSCYTSNHLYEMKKKNNLTRTQKIKSVTPVGIWLELNKTLTECKKESCWAKQLNLKFNDAFAPKSPESWKKNETEWLSSTDITSVLRQYEKAYPEFKYLGPSPSDYFFKESDGNCVWQELCEFNVNTTKYKYIGIVFNLDTHEGPGTHWVSLFVHIPRKKIYYFDSTGEDIHENIQHLVDQIQNQNNKFELLKNYPVEHQFGNTECGMYTLFFIITMLETKNYNYFNGTKTFPDKKMQMLRKKYFNS
jgi:hypothetical protein